MVNYFASAKAFIFPGLDDFGITPVEAMAAGTPVIAYKAGGALDYVTDAQTGVLFNDQSVQSLVDAIEQFNRTKFKESTMTKKADSFSPEKFRLHMRQLIDSEYERFTK